MRDDTRRKSAALLLDALLTTVGKFAHLMLESEVVNLEQENGGGEAP